MIYYNSSTFSAPEQHATFKNDQEVPIASVVRIRDAPFDFWGGGLDYYFQLCFFLKN